MTSNKYFVAAPWACRWLAAPALTLLAATGIAPRPAQAGVFVSVNFAPPVLPVYVQPVIPGPGYIWTPGYWAYDADGGYYWVPGTWVLPPYSGALWTPGYWGWAGGAYVFHAGYWGAHIGFYGGINYGFGYTGVGYAGGYWNGGRFYYNRTVNNVTNNVTNVYNRTVINNVNVRNVSYNGGPNGVATRPTAQETAFSREQHVGAVAEQTHQASLAAGNQQLRASVNHGTPPIAATTRAGVFENGVAARATAAPATVSQHSTAPATASAGSASVRSASFAPQAQGKPTQVKAVSNQVSNPSASRAVSSADHRTHVDSAARHEARVSTHTQSAPAPQARQVHQVNAPHPSPAAHPAAHSANHTEHEQHSHR